MMRNECQRQMRNAMCVDAKMMDQATNLSTPAERLRWARERAGYATAAAAVEAFGWTASTYYGHENGDRTPSREKAKRYGRALRVRWDWILEGQGQAEVENGVEPAGGVTPPPNASIAEEPVRFSRRRIPVLGEAIGGSDGRFILNGQRLTDALCPPSLENVRDAYGVIIRGESMIPRYEPGEIVYADPGRAVRSGDYVVAQIRGEDAAEGEAPEAYVKRFASVGPRELVLKQLNPPEGDGAEMRFPRTRVVSVHKIVATGEG